MDTFTPGLTHTAVLEFNLFGEFLDNPTVAAGDIQIETINPSTGAITYAPVTNLPVTSAGSSRAVLTLTAAETAGRDLITLRLVSQTDEWDSSFYYAQSVAAATTPPASASDGFISYDCRSNLGYGDYHLKRISPITPPVTLDQFKKQIRVELDETYEDDLLNLILEDATSYVQQLSDVTICSNITWLLLLPGFPGTREICLPRQPLLDVLTVNYYDAAEDLQSLTVFSDIVNTNTLLLDKDQSWPATASRPDAVQISYQAGTAEPLTARRAIMLLGSHWYKTREDSVEKALATIPHGVETLIETLRPGDEFDYPV